MPRLVLDTNVLVAALRSRRGASFQLLSLVGSGRFELALLVPLVLEYEDVLLRPDIVPASAEDVGAVLDFLCAVSHHQAVFYLWRPQLPDPSDDLLLELAVAAGCETIVTFNLRDFRGVERFGIEALRPQDFLQTLGEPS